MPERLVIDRAGFRPLVAAALRLLEAYPPQIEPENWGEVQRLCRRLG